LPRRGFFAYALSGCLKSNDGDETARAHLAQGGPIFVSTPDAANDVESLTVDDSLCAST